MISPRSRNYFITINKSAECYNEVKEIIENKITAVHYALITHDKDEKEDGTLKEEHKHAVIELKNAQAFKTIQNIFKGAHIEVPNYKKGAYQYLIHSSKHSKEKYQYTFDEIITNSIDYVKDIIEGEEVEPFIPSKVIEYLAEDVGNYYEFVKRFGLEQAMKWWKGYERLIKEGYKNEQLRQDVAKMESHLKDNDLPF